LRDIIHDAYVGPYKQNFNMHSSTFLHAVAWIQTGSARNVS
jgi:hypothetical protein